MFTLADRLTFEIDSLIRRGLDAQTTREYNADLRRLLPWRERAETKRPLSEFGAILVTVRANENVDAHRHDEEECFIIVSGRADLIVEGQKTTIGQGDVVFMPRFWTHQLCNPYDTAFQFIDLYWDDQQRSFDEFVRDELAGENV